MKYKLINNYITVRVRDDLRRNNAISIRGYPVEVVEKGPKVSVPIETGDIIITKYDPYLSIKDSREAFIYEGDVIAILDKKDLNEPKHINSKHINPKFGGIFVLPFPLNKKIFGLTLFNKQVPREHQLMLGKVFAIANELIDKSEDIHMLEVKVGDIVLYQGTGIEMEIGDKDSVILKGREILGIIK
jgi:co-chaperonin GroES (HSP10)